MLKLELLSIYWKYLTAMFFICALCCTQRESVNIPTFVYLYWFFFGSITMLATHTTSHLTTLNIIKTISSCVAIQWYVPNIRHVLLIQPYNLASTSPANCNTVRPRGLMDKASDFGSEDCEFESRRGQCFFFFKAITGCNRVISVGQCTSAWSQTITFWTVKEKNIQCMVRPNSFHLNFTPYSLILETFSKAALV